MREIKFRVWDKKDKLMLCPDKIRAIMPFISLDGHVYEKGLLQDVVIMQFTGLKDKNGKEIYEGDILKVNNYSRGLLVKFGLCRGGGPNVTFKTLGWNLGKRGETLHDIAILEAEDGEIVGNIYENPELLKSMIK